MKTLLAEALFGPVLAGTLLFLSRTWPSLSPSEAAVVLVLLSLLIIWCWLALLSLYAYWSGTTDALPWLPPHEWHGTEHE